MLNTFLRIILLIVGVALHGELSAMTHVQINLQEVHQRIDGFGASDAWSVNPTINLWLSENEPAQIEALARILFSVDTGIGLSAWRFNIGAGSFEQGSGSQINDALRRTELMVPRPYGKITKGKQLGQIKLLQAARAMGVRQFVAFANSPPVWATKNGLAHPGDGTEIGSTNLSPRQLKQFVRFLVDVLLYLRGDSVGVPVNHISPVNEPSWSWQNSSQEANRYNLQDLKNVYKALYAELKSAGLETDISIDAGEVAEYSSALSDAIKKSFDGNIYQVAMNARGLGVYRNYIDELLGDVQLNPIIHNKLSLHGYWSDADERRLGDLRDAVRDNVRSVAPKATLWMSEFSILGEASSLRPFSGHGFNVEDMDYAIHVARVIHRDLIRLEVSAWFWWLALTPYDYKDGLLKIAPSLEFKTLQASKLMWTLGNFSRFVRPGYSRVTLTGADHLNEVMASAYKDPSSTRLVVVAINASGSEQNLALSITGIKSSQEIKNFDIYVTNADHNLTLMASTNAPGPYLLPSRSVVTLIGRIQ
ncbi:MAG TPA: xylanase [Gammaproteobacteria bacterium]|nr:xylanase [Gammaproteobacteria bacterium]